DPGWSGMKIDTQCSSQCMASDLRCDRVSRSMTRRDARAVPVRATRPPRDAWSLVAIAAAEGPSRRVAWSLPIVANHLDAWRRATLVEPLDPLFNALPVPRCC